MTRDFKGIWIPKEIWLSHDLKIMEKLFLVEIDSLDNEKGCFASNEYFSKFFDLSKNRCSEIIKSLENKGFLEITYYYREGTKSIEKRVLKCSRNTDTPSRESDRGSRKTDRGYSEKCEDNNTCINNTVNNTLKEKNIKKRNAANADFKNIIGTYTTNEELITAFNDYLDMRKSIKAMPTEKALNMLLTKLDRLANNDADKITILNTSTMNNWKGVFAIKKDFGGSYKTDLQLMQEKMQREYNSKKGVEHEINARNDEERELERLRRENAKCTF